MRAPTVQSVDKVELKTKKFVQAKPLLGKGPRVKRRASVAVAILHKFALDAQMYNYIYAQLRKFSRWGFGGGAFFKRRLPQRKLTGMHFCNSLNGRRS